MNLPGFRQHEWAPRAVDRDDAVMQCRGCKAFGVGISPGRPGWCGVPALRNNWKLGDAVSRVIKLDFATRTFALADGRTGKFGEGTLA